MQPQFTPADLKATDEIEALAPWFVTGRLTAAERRLVAARMEENTAFSTQVVLAVAERDATVSVNEQATPTSTAGLDRLMRTLSTAPQPVQWTGVRILNAWLKWAATRATLSPRSMSLAASTAAVVLVAQAVTIGALLPQQNAKYYPESRIENTQSSAGIEVLVSLQPNITASILTSTLVELNAILVDGPKSGLYRLRIGSEKPDAFRAKQIMSEFKSRADVFAFVGFAAVRP